MSSRQVTYAGLTSGLYAIAGMQITILTRHNLRDTERYLASIRLTSDNQPAADEPDRRRQIADQQPLLADHLARHTQSLQITHPHLTTQLFPWYHIAQSLASV